MGRVSLGEGGVMGEFLQVQVPQYPGVRVPTYYPDGYPEKGVVTLYKGFSSIDTKKISERFSISHTNGLRIRERSNLSL